MYLYPYKIFTISKDKRIIKKSPNGLKAVGIYDADKLNYKEACAQAEGIKGSVSILLGEFIGGIKLICLDLDDCFLDNGTIEPKTRELLKEFSPEEYEVSSSGTGMHIYILTKMDLSTFIVKEMEGAKSFECYTNKRHIVTTYFDFNNTNLQVGKHDEFLQELYKKAESTKKPNEDLIQNVKVVFDGTEVSTKADIRGKMYGRTPCPDMFTLRSRGYKDPELINIIDENPENVDQSAHDAKLIRKLMFYTLNDFDEAWEFAKKTNYYKAKDKRHKDKFDNPTYKERTKNFILGRKFL